MGSQIGGFLAGRSLMEIAWNRKSYLALGIAVGLVLALLYYAKTKPIYQSKAQVLVVKKNPTEMNLTEQRNISLEDYVATHQTLIRSPLILARAILHPDEDTAQREPAGKTETDSEPRNKERTGLSIADANRAEFPSKDELMDQILKSLAVTRNRASGGNTSNVIDLSFRWTNDEECPVILDAIIDEYKKFLVESYKNVSEDTKKLVENVHTTLTKDLKKQQDDYRKFREAAANADILVQRGKDGSNVNLERLSNIEAKRSALLVRQAEIKGYLTAIENGMNDKEGKREALLAMVTHWTSNLEGDTSRFNEHLTYKNALYPILQEEQKLLETRGEKHPEVVAIRKRIELARSFLSSPSAQFKTPDTKNTDDPVKMYHDYFLQQLKQIEVSESNLAKAFKEEFKKANAVSNFEFEDEKFRSDITITKKLIESIGKKIEDINLLKDLTGFDAKVIAEPGVGRKVHPNGIIIFPVFLLAGAFAGLGLAFVAEITDRSFHSVGEIRHRLGHAIAGQIPFLKASEETREIVASGKKPLAPVLISYHRPKSVEAESYRGVRTALYFNVHAKGHKVIQVTSPNSGDGKSTLSANLAISIAQSGKKVISTLR